MTPEQKKTIRDCIRSIFLIEKALKLNKIQCALKLCDAVNWDLAMLRDELKQRRK